MSKIVFPRNTFTPSGDNRSRVGYPLFAVSDGPCAGLLVISRDGDNANPFITPDGRDVQVPSSYRRRLDIELAYEVHLTAEDLPTVGDIHTAYVFGEERVCIIQRTDVDDPDMPIRVVVIEPSAYQGRAYWIDTRHLGSRIVETSIARA